QRCGDGVVNDLDQTAADQLLVLNQGQLGLDAGGVAVHHEADRAGGCDDGGLRVAVAVAFADGVGVLPDLLGSVTQLDIVVGAGHTSGRVTVHADNAQEAVAVRRVAGERSAVVAGDARG